MIRIVLLYVACSYLLAWMGYGCAAPQPTPLVYPEPGPNQTLELHPELEECQTQRCAYGDEPAPGDVR
jgi:hypothetical protein